MVRHAIVLGLSLWLLQAGRPQVSASFTRDEFARRRARIAETIGAKAMAVVQGAPSVHSSAIVITPGGARILSDWVPRDMAKIEKLMAEPGLLQRDPLITFDRPR